MTLGFLKRLELRWLQDSYEKMVKIGRGSKISSNAVLVPTDKPIVIGENCSVHDFCVLYGNLTMGNDVRVAAHTVIVPLQHTFESREIPIWKQPNRSVGITIEDDVLIGAGCQILDGAVIRKGAIIGAGSVVTQRSKIEPYSINYGNPCEFRRWRPDKEKKEVMG